MIAHNAAFKRQWHLLSKPLLLAMYWMGVQLFSGMIGKEGSKT
jgi:hypothetical protein